MKQAKPLAGKVAVVTGGSGGIGAAICIALADAGATLVVGYHRSADAACKLAATLQNNGRQHVALQMQVTDSPALQLRALDIEALFGRLDIVVNCAGTTRFVPHRELDQLEDQVIDDILSTNVRGPFAVVRAMHRLLQQSGSGLVVNISSIAAQSAMGSNVIYCASKAALDNMTKSLARALAPQVRVVSVAPGLVDTEFVQGLDQTWRDQQMEKTPLGRLAGPEEVAAAVIAAATHLTFSTGIIIPVEGGRQLS